MELFFRIRIDQVKDPGKATTPHLCYAVVVKFYRAIVVL